MHLPLPLQCLALSAGFAFLPPSVSAALVPDGAAGPRRRGRGHRQPRHRTSFKKSTKWDEQPFATQLSCPSSLPNTHEIDSKTTLSYAVVPPSPSDASNGLFCVRLELDVEEECGWLALAVSRDGYMIGSEAVMGIPDEESVMKYDVNDQWVGAWVPMDNNRQTLRDASVYYDDEEGMTVMEFAKLLVEEDEIPIAEDGVNVFLHARGGRGPGRQGEQESFELDFAEIVPEGGWGGDVLDTVEEADVVGPRAPTEEPTTNMPTTDIPTIIPTEEPTPWPEWYYCVERDEAECFDEDYYWTYYTNFEQCEKKCKGWKECRANLCLPIASPSASPTRPPTASPSTTLPTNAPTAASPTSSVAPTKGLTMSPTLSPAMLLETLAMLDSAARPAWDPTADVLPTDNVADNEGGEVAVTAASGTSAPPEFTFTAPKSETDRDGVSYHESVPLTPFRLDFAVAATSRDGNNGDGSDSDWGDRWRLSEEEGLFEEAQDAALLSLVSSHLYKQFEKNLGGDLRDVVLTLDVKSELVGASSAAIVASYDLVGYAVYTQNDEKSAAPPPSTADLDSRVLEAFNSRKGKRAWLRGLGYAEDDALRGIADVIASTRHLPSRAIGNADGAGDVGGDGGGGAAIAAPFVALVALAIASVFFVLGLLTFRKYRRYHDNNSRNDYLSYQHKKRKITINAHSKKVKHYDHFESPEGSVAGSEYLIVDAHRTSTSQVQDHNDFDTSSPGGKQFHPFALDAIGDDGSSVPYDESPNAAAAYGMTCFSHAANQLGMPLMDQSRIDGGYETENPHGCDETLEGLYSDKDSYFQSTIGGASSAIGGQHRRGDSIHSLDTLDNTFGNGNDGLVSHLIDGIDAMMKGNSDVSQMEGLSMESSLFSPIKQGSECGGVGDNILTETTRKLLEIHDITHISVEDDDLGDHVEVVRPTLKVKTAEEVIESSNDAILKWRTSKISHDQYEDEADKHAIAIANENSDENDADAREDSAVDLLESQAAANDDTSAISTTDELYARITELEKKILNTESQLARNEGGIFTKTPPKAGAEGTRSPPPASTPYPYNSKGDAVVSGESLPSAIMTPEISMRKSTLTGEALGMIEQSRLRVTPPPSEDEVDNEMIREAQENSLLWKSLGNHTDPEEEGGAFELL